MTPFAAAPPSAPPWPGSITIAGRPENSAIAGLTRMIRTMEPIRLAKSKTPTQMIITRLLILNLTAHHPI
jgi:hypothetical protein